MRRELGWCWLVGCALLLGHGPVAAQSPQNSDAEAKPITVFADSVQGWSQDQINGMVARGNVSIERGMTRVRMKQAILWISKPTSENGIISAVLYGEGAVSYEENSKPKRNFESIALHWTTAEEVRVKSPNKTSGEPEPGDPFYQRAQRTFQQPPALNAGPPEEKPQEKLPPPAPVVDSKKTPPTHSVKQQRDFNRDPISPSPDLANVLQRAGTLGISSRGTTPFQFKRIISNTNESAILVWGGITLYATDENNIIDISTDRAVIWVKGMGTSGVQGLPNFNNLRREQVELYLEGHVEIRYARLTGPSAGVQQLVLAEKGYYDIGRNVALLANCEVIYHMPGLAIPIHLQSREVRQINLNNFQAHEAVFFASRLPSDPDIKILAGDLSVELREMPKKGMFGTTAFDPFTNSTLKNAELYGVADNVKIQFMDMTVGALRHTEGDLRDPFGPIEDIRFRADGVFGMGLQLGLDGYQLFGKDKPADTRWRIDPLFYGRRGPGLITEFQTAGVGALGFPGRYDTFVRGHLQYDYGDTDILSVDREPLVPQELRGLLLLRHRQELTENWSFQTQVGYQSDRNFYEQWWKRPFDEDTNQETYLQLKYQYEQFAMTGLVKANIRNWVNESSALPRVDGWLVGQDLFRTLSYFGHASAGLYRFNTTSDVNDAYFNTAFPNEFDRYRPLPPSSDMPHRPTFNLARFDIMNELDWPVHLGVLNLTPYGLADAAYYTDDMSGNDGGRLWYGGGVRAALPMSKLYSNVQSDFFNVRGVNHKVSLEADYRYTRSNVDFRRLPLIDRLDDDATDQARRDLRMYRLANGINLNLATSDLYDPQLYALRRGYLGSPDNLDDMEYLRFGVRNRWQTKRGIADAERAIDWISFDLFASYFPQEGRDNYGNPFGLIDYDFRWQVGERTSVLSSAVIDPFSGGGRSFNIGVLVERTERLRWYLGYYRLDPVGTDALLVSSSYVISPKYSVSWSSSIDFGQGRNLGQSFMVTRTGSDLQVSLGLGWDPLRDNFNVTLEVFPTILGPTRHMRRIAPGLTTLDTNISPY